MRDFEVRTNSRMDAGFTSLAQRIDSNQQDILRQFQFYFENPEWPVMPLKASEL